MQAAERQSSKLALEIEKVGTATATGERGLARLSAAVEGRLRATEVCTSPIDFYFLLFFSFCFFFLRHSTNCSSPQASSDRADQADREMADQLSKLELKVVDLSEQSASAVQQQQRTSTQQYTHMQQLVDGQAAELRQLMIRLEAESKQRTAQHLQAVDEAAKELHVRADQNELQTAQLHERTERGHQELHERADRLDTRTAEGAAAVEEASKELHMRADRIEENLRCGKSVLFS
eukprot:SAG31_NODE_1646_length_7649_cov_3.317616_3_plen_235_part_00